MDGSSVAVGRISVARESPGRVGGSVEVTNTSAGGAGVSSENVMQEPRLRLASSSRIQSFFMKKILLGKD
jgi:hypothetical protein